MCHKRLMGVLVRALQDRLKLRSDGRESFDNSSETARRIVASQIAGVADDNDIGKWRRGQVEIVGQNFDSGLV